MQCGVTRRQEEGEIKGAKDVKDRGNEKTGVRREETNPGMGSRDGE